MIKAYDAPTAAAMFIQHITEARRMLDAAPHAGVTETFKELRRVINEAEACWETLEQLREEEND